ncbi:MAG: CDP-glycerol glycerophosphotransferase family protein [Lachnotalea sp.]
MEQSFWQKLQRVKLHDLIHVIFFILAVPIAFVYRLFRRDLWLICDNENEARDNGYWLYKYIVENHPSQDVMYAINMKSPDYIKVKTLGKVVQYASFLHWFYYLTASKNISSQKGGKPDAALCYVLEVYGIIKNTRIFLQHGIIKDDMPFLYYKNTKIRLFVTSTRRECEYISNTYGYPDGWVKELGLCRLDNLHDKSKTKRQILIMPTWRNWIGRPTTESYKHEDISEFTNTDYYQHWNQLLSDERLLSLLDNNNIDLVFYPHRDMQQFLKEFQIDHNRIIIASWPQYDVQQLLKDSAVLITDYSSVAMDFAYMKKPLIYYQFDYEKFRTGHYPEGYFSYEKDGFGKVCKEEDGVIEELKVIIQNEFKNKEEYLIKNKEFFTTYDNHNCERNYQAILELE